MPARQQDLPNTDKAGSSATASPAFASDFELKIVGNEFMMRKKGTQKWVKSQGINEPIVIGLLYGNEKIYAPTKAIQPPKAIHMEEPNYPVGERNSVGSDQVTMHIVVDQNGKVSSEKVDFTPSVELSDAAVKAVRQWTFSPAKLNGEPVAVLMVVVTMFRGY